MPILSQPLVCPILIGREPVLSELSALLKSDAHRDRVVLLTGEAGIGKTRLAEAVAERAQADGWCVFEAHCYQQDRGLAYAAPLNLLRHIATTGQLTAREALRPVAGTIGGLLPQIQDLVADDTAVELAEPGQATRRLFEAVSATLALVTQSAPTLLIVEDLHWADQASLDWIAFLAREQRTAPLILLATYRSDEVGAGLGQLLAALDRERLSAEVVLGQLTLTQVDAMVHATLGDNVAIRADALQTLHRRTEGVPFLVEELLRSALADGNGGALSAADLADARIPRGIHEAVVERLGALSSDARELLSIAAVIGDHFDLALLRTVSNGTEDALLSLLRELGGQQLLVEVADGQFRFRHALTRDTVLALSFKVQRRTQHARVAAAIESLGNADEYAEELAYHLFEAGEWQRALAFGRIAGQRALQVYAPHSALEHLGRAIEAAAHLGRTVVPDLLLHRARAFEAIGAFDDARRDFEFAIHLAEEGGDPATLGDALLGLALLWSARDYVRSREYLDRGVEVASARGDSIAHARALGRLANWHSNNGHYGEARSNLDQALELVRATGDERAIAEIVDLLGMTCLVGGRFTEALSFLLEAGERFGSLEDRRSQSSPLASVSVLAGSYQSAAFEPALTLTEATAFVDTAIAAAREDGTPSAIAYALWQSGFVLGPRGEYARALAVTREALQIAEQNKHRQWAVAARCVLGAIALDLLNPAEAISVLECARNESLELGSAIWVHQSTALLADALLHGGRAADAASLVHEGLAALQGTPGLTIAFGWYGCVEADIMLADGDPAGALAVLDARFGGSSALRVLHTRARALAHLGKRAEARADFERALGSARRQGNRSYEWRILADLTQLQLSIGSRERARVSALATLRLIEAIADGNSNEVGTRAFPEHATLRLPALFRPRSRRGDATGLSARELEVARLVARGMTNRAIADHLVLSVRTIETHVAHGIARSGQGSRSGLAAWVVEHGLLHDG